MTMQSSIALYTPDYYDINEAAILDASRCGNPGLLIQIDNFSYYAIKACEYEANSRDYTPEGLIQDLTDLRNGDFFRYAMTVADYHTLSITQKTEGDSTDHVRFERFTDPVYGGRWRLILSNRESVNAFSISVYNDAGGYLYTPGSFIDQGNGTWKIESNYVQYDGGNVNFAFLSGSLPITETYHVDKDISEAEWFISYFE